MKQPGTLVHHGGEDYLCVEGGFNAETRTVTLMTGAANTEFPHRPETKAVTWCDQGQWYVVARWSADDLLLPDPRHHARRDLAADVVEQYLASRPETPEALWAVKDGKGFRGHLLDVMPQGLAAEIHESLEAAEASGGDAGLVPVQDVPRFLTHLAREGYAGALWNASQPVFFCLDESDELQFLRVGQAAPGKVAMEILDGEEGWTDYEGERSIEFLDNAEACDARLVEQVGRVALLDWPAAGPLWSLGPREGEAGVVTVAEDGLAYGLLFTSEAACREWLGEEIEAPWTAFRVGPLADFLSQPSLVGSGALINPGAHRARRGVLWSDGERLILDSFSGFWELLPDGFQLIPDAADAELPRAHGSVDEDSPDDDEDAPER